MVRHQKGMSGKRFGSSFQPCFRGGTVPLARKSSFSSRNLLDPGLEVRMKSGSILSHRLAMFSSRKSLGASSIACGARMYPSTSPAQSRQPASFKKGTHCMRSLSLSPSKCTTWFFTSAPGRHFLRRYAMYGVDGAEAYFAETIPTSGALLSTSRASRGKSHATASPITRLRSKPSALSSPVLCMGIGYALLLISKACAIAQSCLE
mmetsp:Transcript_49178/g.93925  ORF Transcript_49178/g.93925 Transcript_49178/m.93925 type:complete len:206 (-) Transcript_49178:1876-2493(-)